MAIVERRIQTLHASKFEEFKTREKKWSAIETKLGGFEPKRHMSSMFTPDQQGTTIWERNWESLASMEAAYGHMGNDADAKALGAQSHTLVSFSRIEIYNVFDLD
jgi:hypothetical protein